MEHDEKPLPIDIRLLGALAEKVPPFTFLSCPCARVRVRACVCVCVSAHDACVSWLTHVALLYYY